MPTVPTSPFQPMVPMGQGEVHPDIKSVLSNLRDAAKEDWSGFTPYSGFRQSPNTEDRRGEEWPTASVKGRRDQEELLDKEGNITQSLTEKAELERFNRHNPDVPPSSDLSRDLGEGDLTKFISALEAYSPRKTR